MAVALPGYITDLSSKSISDHGTFPRGSLIRTLRKILEPLHVSKTQWAKWMIFWLDERVVPLNHHDSNHKLAFDGFLGFAKFVLMLVGMGPDGHIASLFCWHFQHFEKKWVAFITDSPKPPPPRITFTFPLINSASEIALVVTGEDAADAVKVGSGEHASYGYPLPVQKVKPEGGLTWFLD